MLLVAATLSVLAPPALARPGGPDPVWGDDGIATLDLEQGADDPSGAAAGPLGSLVVATLGTSDGASVLTVRRSLANGMPDPTFGSGGRTDVTVAIEARPGNLVVTPGGAVLAAVGVPGGVDVVRLGPTGSLDRGFGADGHALVAGALTNDADLGVDAEGRIVVPVADRPVLRVHRLRPDGTPDPDWGDEGTTTLSLPFTSGDYVGPTPHVLDLVVRPDGRAVLSTFGNSRYRWDPCLLGLTATGEVDPGFAVPGTMCGAGHLGEAMALDGAGRILTVAAAGVGRLLPDGRADPSFTPAGITSNLELRDVAVDGDRIYATGAWSHDRSEDPVVVGLDSAGRPLTAIGPGGWRVVDHYPDIVERARTVVVRPLAELAGPITLVGDAAQDSLASGLDRSGVPAPTFAERGALLAGSATDSKDVPVDLSFLATGGAYLVGTATQANRGDPGTVLTRFRADGTLDPAFDGDGRLHLPRFAGYGRAVLAVSAGRALVAGSSAGSQFLPGDMEHEILTVERRLPTGALDPTFGGDGVIQVSRDELDLPAPDRYSDEEVLAVDLAPGPDGSAYALVSFGHRYRNHSGARLVRITASGSLDPAFGGGVVDPRLILPDEMVSLGSSGSEGVALAGFGVDPGTGEPSTLAPITIVRLTASGDPLLTYGVAGRRAIDVGGGQPSGVQPGDPPRCGRVAFGPDGTAVTDCTDALRRYSPLGVRTGTTPPQPSGGTFLQIAVDSAGTAYGAAYGPILRWAVGGPQVSYAPAVGWGLLRIAPDGSPVAVGPDVGGFGASDDILVQRLSLDPNSFPVASLTTPSDISLPEGQTGTMVVPARITRTLPYDLTLGVTVRIGKRPPTTSSITIPRGATTATLAVELHGGLAHTSEVVSVRATEAHARLADTSQPDAAVLPTAAVTATVRWTPPLPPAVVPSVAATAGDGFATVTWGEAPSRPGVTLYGVLARRGARIVAQAATPADTRRVSLAIPNLGGPAAVTVYACNKGGCGPESAPVSVTPAVGAPVPLPPAAPTVVLTGPRQTGPAVRWQPAEDRGRAITHYAVALVRRSTGRLVRFEVVPADVRQLTFAGAPQNSDHEARISAYDGVTWGEPAVRQLTDEPPLYADHQAFGTTFTAAYPTGPSSIYVTWGPAMDDGGNPIQSYSVVVVDGTTLVRWVNQPVHARSLSLAGLPRGRVLSVYAWPNNALGNGLVGEPTNLVL